jgi:hypothetical protein
VVPERERHTIQSEKVMLTIAWNPTGFDLIDFLSRRAKFNGTHDVTNLLSPLAIWREAQIEMTDRKLIVHSDNSGAHTARRALDFLEQNGMERAPHPPYSPDLAPCDFSLFGSVKNLRADREIADVVKLHEAVIAIFDSIGNVTLGEVFLTWQDFRDASKSMESMWSKQSHFVNRTSSFPSRLAKLIGPWDILYMEVQESEFVTESDVCRLSEERWNIQTEVRAFVTVLFEIIVGYTLTSDGGANSGRSINLEVPKFV